MEGKEGTALNAGRFQPRQGGQEKKDTGLWCDHHNSSSHSNAQCYSQGAKRPPRSKAKANTARAETPNASASASATVASSNIPENYDSDGSAFNASTANHTTKAEDEFIIDSGASHHMVFSSSLLKNIRPLPSTKHVRIGDGTFLPYSSAGTLHLGGIRLENVFLVPGLSCNLISVRSTPSRYRWDFSPHLVTLYNHSDSTPLLTAHIVNDLYTFKASRYHALTANSADTLAELKDWHLRLGHLNVQSIMRLFRAGRIHGLDAVTSKLEAI